MDGEGTVELDGASVSVHVDIPSLCIKKEDPSVLECREEAPAVGENTGGTLNDEVTSSTLLVEVAATQVVEVNEPSTPRREKQNMAPLLLDNEPIKDTPPESPRIDIVEYKDRYHLYAELPPKSAHEQDIHVEVSENKFIISSERKDTYDGADRVVRREIDRGGFKRVLELPEDADASDIDVSLGNDRILQFKIRKVCVKERDEEEVCVKEGDEEESKFLETVAEDTPNGALNGSTNEREIPTEIKEEKEEEKTTENGENARESDQVQHTQKKAKSRSSCLIQ